jgi:hypothetical protein
VKRFAQDDGFVVGLEIQLVGVQKTRKIEKVTGSQDDGFAGVLTKKKTGQRLWTGILG